MRIINRTFIILAVSNLTLLFASFRLYGNPTSKYYLSIDIDSNRFSQYLDHLDRLKIKKGTDAGLNLDRKNLQKVNQLIKTELNRFPGVLSLKNSQFGLFYNSELHGRFPPYFQVFGGAARRLGGKSKTEAGYLKNECITFGDFRSSLLNEAGLAILDLNDAYVTIQDMDFVSKIQSLEVLGMPRRSMKYNARFSFPANLKTLVVRNAELTPFFFEAIGKLTSLRELFLIECTARDAYDWPSSSEFGNNMDDRESNLSKKIPFQDVAKTIERLSIVNSDPIIFENLTNEKWVELEEVQADIYTSSDGLRALFSKTQEDFRKSFPSLKKCNLRIYDSGFFEDLLMEAESHKINDLSFDISQMLK